MYDSLLYCIFNFLNGQYVLVIACDDLKMKIRCPDEEFIHINGITLRFLQITASCTNLFKLDNKQTTQIVLKKIPLIKDIPLQENHKLKTQIKASNQLSIDKMVNNSNSLVQWFSTYESS